MPFTVDKLTGIPAIVLTPSENGMLLEVSDMETRVLALFDSQTEPAFLIVDMRRVRMGLEDVMQNANSIARDQPKMLTHPNLRELLVISLDKLIKLAIQGMSSPIFGGLQIRVFESPELALAYCREQIASVQSSDIGIMIG